MTKTTLIALFLIGTIVVLFLLHPWPLYQKLFAIAYGLDPQRPSHTYILGGLPLPLEARKTGMFGGFLVTYLYLLALGRGRAADFPPRCIMALLIAFVGLMGLDGLNATLFDLDLPHLYAPALRLRLATGLLTGLTMAVLLLPALNGTLWRDIVVMPSLRTGREVFGAILLAMVVFVAVDARPAILYYPVGILGCAGLVAELTLINMILLLAITRRVGRADSVWDVLPPASAGLVLSICELSVMSIVRYLTLGDLTSLM